MTAYYPHPVDGAVDVSPAPILTWQPGKLTVAHNVFFSDNVDAVTQGAGSVDALAREIRDKGGVFLRWD